MTLSAESPQPHGNPSSNTLTIDLANLPGVATAFGVSLVSATIVLSSLYSRKHDDLDFSNFAMGVLATLGLLAIAAAAQLLVPDPKKRELLVSWPGAFGAAGVGMMLATLITKDTLAEHIAPLAALAIAVAGYLLTRSTPFVLVTLGSLALFYARLFDDLFDTNTDDGSGNFMLIGGGVLVFVVGATALGWLLPATQVVVGVVTGIGGLAAMAGLLAAVGIARVFTVGFGGGFNSSDYGSGSFDPESGTFDGSSGPFRLPTPEKVHDPFKNDVYMILLYCLALAAIWMVAALLTGHVGFRLLVLATAIVIVPLASFALIVHHPTWWELVTGALGGLVLAGIGVTSMARPTPPTPTPPTPPTP